MGKYVHIRIDSVVSIYEYLCQGQYMVLRLTLPLSYEYVLLLSFFQMELSYLSNRVLI
jgi:hypothetical protein